MGNAKFFYLFQTVILVVLNVALQNSNVEFRLNWPYVVFQNRMLRGRLYLYLTVDIRNFTSFVANLHRWVHEILINLALLPSLLKTKQCWKDESPLFHVLCKAITANNRHLHLTLWWGGIKHRFLASPSRAAAFAFPHPGRRLTGLAGWVLVHVKPTTLYHWLYTYIELRGKYEPLYHTALSDAMKLNIKLATLRLTWEFRAIKGLRMLSWVL